jgi:hypothetical protein
VFERVTDDVIDALSAAARRLPDVELVPSATNHGALAPPNASR